MIKNYPTASKASIENLEKNISIELPTDFKLFLEKENGKLYSEVRPKITIEDLGEDIFIELIYGIIPENRRVDIEFWTKELEDDLLENTVVTGNDYIGGIFVMVTAGENQGIYYWDDTYRFEESDDETNTYFIADTFTEFLSLITLEKQLLIKMWRPVVWKRWWRPA